MSNKYEIGKVYSQSNKKEIDQFTNWLNMQDNNINSGIGNAQSIAPAYYINRDLDMFILDNKKIPAYLVIINSLNDKRYNNFTTKDKYIYHWGDSKFKNNTISVDDFNGNRLFKLIYDLVCNSKLELIPPILYFDKPKSGKLIFKGICVLEELFLVNDFKDKGCIMPNYLAKFKLTNDNEITVNTLHQRARSKTLEDLLLNIPSGLKEEILRIKNTKSDSHIKNLTLNDYLKIKGEFMEEKTDLQKDILENENLHSEEFLETESGILNTSEDNLDNKNISYWLLAIDNLDTHFSRVDTNRDVCYEVTYSSDLSSDINPNENDFIIGYISNPSSPKSLKYVFKITEVSNNQFNISITLKKLFETCIDISVDSILDKAPSTYNNMISTDEINRLISKIPYNEFNKLIKFMLENLASSIFNLTLTQINDVFDITKHIAKEELEEIAEAQNALLTKIRNKIVYGAPGTGKSHKVNKFKNEFFKNDFLFERVTFHPSYTYGQFVGAYKPSPIYSKNESDKTTSWYGADKIKNDALMNPHIDYSLVAGPFLNMLCKALNNPNYSFLLIIEEMNRANAAAVFGDVFQLLDRNSDNTSTYSLKFNSDITNFLVSNIKNSVNKDLFDKDTGFIKIPNNLFIWGTMNSADEGVSKMDSAFKRRWSFEYTDIDPIEGSEKHDTITKLAIYLPFLNSGKGGYISWNKFREKLNLALLDINKMLPEDKYIGPFFLNEKELLDEDIIKSKLLLYLKDDVLKHSSNQLFKYSRFSDISRMFNIENIFNDKYINSEDLEPITDLTNYKNLKYTTNDTEA